MKLETASLCIAQNKEVVGHLTRLGDPSRGWQREVSADHSISNTVSFIMANLEYGI